MKYLGYILFFVASSVLIFIAFKIDTSSKNEYAEGIRKCMVTYKFSEETCAIMEKPVRHSKY